MNKAIYKTARVISIVVQKGGNGKTITAACLGASLAKLGQKALLIDFDPQSNLTEAFFSEESIEQSIYNIIENDMENRQAISPKDVILNYTCNDISLDLLPSSPELWDSELRLIGQSGREFFLRRIIEEIVSYGIYDFIIIDGPPNLGVLTINILASHPWNEIIIPVKRGRSSERGIKHLFDSIKTLQKRNIAQLAAFNFLMTEYIDKQIIDRNTVNSLENQYPDNVFETKIRKNTTIDAAMYQQIDIFNYDPNSYIAQDYLRLAKEVLAEGGSHE